MIGVSHVQATVKSVGISLDRYNITIKTVNLPGAKQTLASNCSVNTVEPVITDCSPGTVVVDFQTSLQQESIAYQSHWRSGDIDTSDGNILAMVTVV